MKPATKMRYVAWIAMVGGLCAVPAFAEDWPAGDATLSDSAVSDAAITGAKIPSLVPDESIYQSFTPTSGNTATYPGLAEYRALACQSRSGSSRYPYDRYGYNTHLFPWATGPGRRDNWRVGPKWQVAVDGIMLFRDNADWSSVIAGVGSAPSLVDQFGSGPGARLFVTGYNESGFGLQVGYEGVNSWNAASLFPLAGATRSFDYETTLNSLEINFFPRVPFPWKFFSGVRYVEIDEDFRDFTTNDKSIPAPADPPAAPVVVIDSGSDFLLKNQLIGFQLGARRDTWQWNKWLTIESFANAGVYHNRFKRTDVARTVTTVTNGDDLATPDTDEFSQQVTEVNTATRLNTSNIAFLGEVGITGVVRLNESVALRVGYQAMVVDGVGEGLNAFFASGFDSSTLLYHGLQFGAEYRR